MFTTTIQGNSLILGLSGTLKGAECKALQQAAHDKAFEIMKSRATPTDRINTIYLDMKGLTFIDSAGLGVLIGIKALFRKHQAKTMLLSATRHPSNSAIGKV